MCTMCLQISEPKDECPLGEASGPIAAEINEINDASASGTAGTNYSMSVGDTFTGTLAVAGDRDWVSISLTGGNTYSVALDLGTLDDTFLRIYDQFGSLMYENDDGGPGFASALTFTATVSGTYYLEAGAFADASTGTYAMSVNEAAPATPGDLDEMATFLTEGYWGGTSQRYDTSAGDNTITVNISGLSAGAQQLALWALEAWETVANIDFVVTTGSAEMTFQQTDAGAYASSSTLYSPTSTSDRTITSSTVNISTAWVNSYGTSIDSYSFQTFVHEIGHALGLGHQGNYNGSATYGADETFSNDSWQYSVMSYFSQAENTSTNASYAALAGPMLSDILAIQSLYGAAGAGSATDGNTVYGANSNIGGAGNPNHYMRVLFDALANNTTNASYTGGNMAFTLADAGGYDTIDLSYQSTNNLISLIEESFSNVGGLIGNLAIARGSVIEHATGGSGNDTMIGNEANNDLVGNDGADVFYGNGGADRLYGGLGNDTFFGGAGGDEIYGEGGNDEIGGADGNDNLFGGYGNDTIYGGAGNDTLGGSWGADGLWGGSGGDQIYGGNGNDQIGGADGWDQLYGGDGDEVIFGGTGNDRIGGGNGNDSIYAAQDDDTVWAGAGDDFVNGFTGNDELNGGQGNDTLNGGAGTDTINGGTESNLLSGGVGNDTFIYAGGFDTISDFEADNALEKIDFSNFSDIIDFSDLMSNHVVGVGSDVMITNNAGIVIMELQDVLVSALDASDFIF